MAIENGPSESALRLQIDLSDERIDAVVLMAEHRAPSAPHHQVFDGGIVVRFLLFEQIITTILVCCFLPHFLQIGREVVRTLMQGGSGTVEEGRRAFPVFRSVDAGSTCQNRELVRYREACFFVFRIRGKLIHIVAHLRQMDILVILRHVFLFVGIEEGGFVGILGILLDHQALEGPPRRDNFANPRHISLLRISHVQITEANDQPAQQNLRY